MAFSTVLLVFIAITAAIAAAVYFIGIPAEWKEEVQKQLMMRAGENQARDMLNDQLSKLPEADRKNVDGLASGIEKLSGGKADLRNPLGGILGGKDD